MMVARQLGAREGFTKVVWLTELDGHAVYELSPEGHRPRFSGRPFLVSINDQGFAYELSNEQFHRVMQSL